MSSGFESGSNDGIHAGLLQCCRFVWWGRRANGDDAFGPALLQDLSRRDSKDEADDRNVRLQQHADLVFESDRRVGLVRWTRSAQCSKVAGERRQAPVEFGIIRASGAFV